MKSMRGFRGIVLLRVIVMMILGITMISPGTGSAFELNTDLEKNIALAQKARRAGDFAGAIERLESSLVLIGEKSGEVEESRIRLELGHLYWNVGQVEKAKGAYERAGRLAQKSGGGEELRLSGVFLNILADYAGGKDARATGNFSESIRLFERAIGAAGEIKSREHMVKCLRQLSLVYWETNDLEKYLSLAKDALALAKALNHKKEEGVCLNNVGLYFSKKGDYFAGLKYYHETLDIGLSIKDDELKALASSNIATAYFELGDKEKALNYYVRIIEIDEKLNNDYYLAIDLNNIGIIWKTLDNPLRRDSISIAQEYCTKALSIARKISNKKLEREILVNLGEISLAKRESGEALEYYRSAFSLTDGFRDDKISSIINNGIANAYLQKKLHSQAIRHFENALAHVNDPEASGIAWESYYGLGRCFEELNDDFKAAECYARAVEKIESSRPNLSLDTIGSGFIKNKMFVFEALIDLLRKLRLEREAELGDDILFSYIEKAKARTFLDGLANSKIDIWKNLSASRQKQIENITHRIESLNVQLAKEIRDQGRFRELTAALGAEEDRYMLSIARFEQEDGGRRDLALSKPVPARMIQNQLDDRTAIVEYFLGERSSTVLILTRKRIDALSVASRDDIEASVKGFAKCVSSPRRPGIDEKAAARRILPEIGLAEIAARYPLIDRLIIVPDGPLHDLPFESLILPGAGRDKYLVERYRVSYAPSATIYYWLKTKPRLSPHAGGILAFGDPEVGPDRLRSRRGRASNDLFLEMYLDLGYDFTRLPHSRKEVMNAAGYFPAEDRRVYLGSRAREASVAENFSRSFQVVHFACHAFVDSRQPVRSALVLTADPKTGDDGFLQVRELYNRRIEANLVVLSACQTGRGRLEAGEGILGLPRIFFYAGASSVITTLWPVGDANAQKIMAAFYRYLAGGDSKAGALQKAKIEMILSGSRDPHEWAGFVLNGEPDQPVLFR
jgi:CHAT domain-containing protein/Tfp pilus assembly protein PilF